MTLKERQKKILQQIQKAGYVGIEELVEQFTVSAQTIRGDLNQLADQGLLVRQHGGASVASSVFNSNYIDRRNDFSKEKDAIARKIAELMPDRSSVFLTPGTTMLAVARALIKRTDLKIITNNVEAAQILVQQERFDVILIGGHLEARNMGVGGTTALNAVREYRADYCIFSAGGIDTRGELLEYHESEAAVVKAMLECSRKSVLAVDHSKFGRLASVRIGSLHEITTLVTDKKLPANIDKVLKNSALKVITAK